MPQAQSGEQTEVAGITISIISRIKVECIRKNGSVSIVGYKRPAAVRVFQEGEEYVLIIDRYCYQD